jgi:hypothetical protein
MFLTFQGLYERCQKKTDDTDSNTLAMFKENLNIGLSEAYTQLNSEYFYTSATDATVASKGSYPRPYHDCLIKSMKINNGSKDYIITEFIGGENAWIALNANSDESDIPNYFFVKRNTFELYPIPATADYTITTRIKRIAKALSQADYTTGTIKTMVNGSTAVVGNTGTNWTTPTVTMAGRFFKIDDDGFWYEISSITNATNLVLVREFGGTAVTAGTASYTIGEGSLLPFEFAHIPVNYALWQYYADKKDKEQVNRYQAQWQQDLQNLKSFGSRYTTTVVIDEDITIPYYPDWPTGLT